MGLERKDFIIFCIKTIDEVVGLDDMFNEERMEKREWKAQIKI